MNDMERRFFNIERIFIFSLFLNIIFLLVFGYFFSQPNRLKQLKQMILPEKSVPKPIFKPNYYIQKSHFETLPDIENEIIFLGDSLTDLGRWSEMFQNINIKNRGIRADRTDGVLERLQEVVLSLPDKIFIMIGVNDLSRKRKISEIIANYEKILRFIQKNSPQTKIFVQSVLPVNEDIPYRIGHADNDDIIRLNTELKQLCSHHAITFIDLFPFFKNENNKLKEELTLDGLHPNGKGYLVWKSVIEKYVSD
jgi:lysophospholipase L1-like esterase